MAKSVKDLVEAADAVVPRVTAARAKELIEAGNAVVVDVRDTAEVETSGKVAGALHIPRGML
jgi:rhodanese-related sulfurtransferase